MSNAVEFTYDGEKISVEGGALEISKDSSGLRLKFNRTPSSAWSTAGKKVGSDFGVRIDDASHLQSQSKYSLSANVESRPEWLLDGKRELKDYDSDPHSYKSYYSNGYSVGDSVNRAVEHVLYNPWGNIHVKQRRTNDLRKVVRAMIVNGAGRDSIYKLAGKVGTLEREGALTTSTERTATDVLNMMGYLEGYLKSPIKL